MPSTSQIVKHFVLIILLAMIAVQLGFRYKLGVLLTIGGVAAVCFAGNFLIEAKQEPDRRE